MITSMKSHIRRIGTAIALQSDHQQNIIAFMERSTVGTRTVFFLRAELVEALAAFDFVGFAAGSTFFAGVIQLPIGTVVRSFLSA
jgi:hypothetical protein